MVPHKILYWGILKVLQPVNGEMIFYRAGEKAKVYKILSRIVHEKRVLTTFSELYQIYTLVERIKKIPGAMAEVGVSMGGTAKVICEAKGDTALYLFDTYTGLPAPGLNDDVRVRDADERFYAGQFACSLEKVQAYLGAYPNVIYIPGLFPDSTKNLTNPSLKFSFVHLDMDLHDGTKLALEWFYPRMCPGGIILIHDYFQIKGVRNAVDDFFSRKPEAVLFGNCTNGMVVKN